MMKALSIRQPWAWLIAHGYKDVENRNWRTTFRGRIYVHASSRFIPVDWQAIYAILNRLYGVTQDAPEGVWHELWTPLARGAIIGEIDIVDCVTVSGSPWFEGPYGLVLANPMAYEKPIPYKGRLGFFEVTL